MIDTPGFRAAFPVFESATTFPDAQVDFWLDQAPNALSLDRLGNQADLATCLYIAHNLTLGYQDQQAANTGTYGKVAGPISSSSVGGVSKSVDVGSTASGSAGYYNATGYGRQLWQLLRRYSLGGTYIAAPSSYGANGYYFAARVLPPSGI